MVALAWSVFSIKSGCFRKQSFIVRADDFDPNPSGTLKHGIDKEKALREGVVIELILAEFKKDITSFSPQLLVAHNIEFDLQVLRSECARIGFDLAQAFALPKFCTMKEMTLSVGIPRGDLSGEFERRVKAYRRDHNMRTKWAQRRLAYYKDVLSREIKSRRKWPTLQELSLYLFGVPLENWHDALADVEACERCFRAIAEQKLSEHASWQLKKAQLEVAREEHEKRKKAWNARKQILTAQLAEAEVKAHKVVFNLPNYIFASFVLLLTVFLPPIGILLGFVGFFGIRGDHKWAKAEVERKRRLIREQEAKYLN
jgi:hypothetical protein